MSYSELTHRYFDRAPLAGTLDGPRIATGAAGGRAQGVWVQFQLQLESGAPDGPLVAQARFLAFGCPHVIAVAAWIAEQAVGRPARPDLPHSPEALRRLFDAPVEKLGRLFVVEDAWIAAVAAIGRGD